MRSEPKLLEAFVTFQCVFKQLTAAPTRLRTVLMPKPSDLSHFFETLATATHLTLQSLANLSGRGGYNA
jgi:hypothetical protein